MADSRAQRLGFADSRFSAVVKLEMPTERWPLPLSCPRNAGASAECISLMLVGRAISAGVFAAIGFCAAGLKQTRPPFQEDLKKWLIDDIPRRKRRASPEVHGPNLADIFDKFCFQRTPAVFREAL